jgi:hypothetical protein
MVSRSLRRQGWVLTWLVIEAKDIKIAVTEVHVFGDFTKDPWQIKLPCRKSKSGEWRAEAMVRVGHKFKFMLDGGKDFVISTRYIQNVDA